MPHLLAGLPLLPVLCHHGAPAAPHVIISVTWHLNIASKRTEDTLDISLYLFGVFVRLYSSHCFHDTAALQSFLASEAIMNHDFR